MSPVVQRVEARENKISQFVRAVTVCAALLCALPAQGQLNIPVGIGTPNAITDEFGVNLRGTATGTDTNSDLVVVLWAPNGIEPPDVDGAPSTNNPPVDGGTSHVGSLTAPDLVDAGIFSVALSEPRPPQNSKIFVRVFNAPKQADASFYADSQLFTVDGNANLYVNITATTNAIDPRDSDSDGLNNSWEKSLGANPYNPDTDGDGMIDGDERRAGTEMTNDESLLIATQVRGQGIQWTEYDEFGQPFLVTGYRDAIVSWQSVPGKIYQVECMDGSWTDLIRYTNVNDVITATDVVTETTITNGMLSGVGKFRVRLVEP